MKTHQMTLFVTVPIVILSFIAGFIMELSCFSISHSTFYSGVFIGIFASGLVLVFVSISSYIVEKGKYYKLVFHYLKELTTCTQNLIEETIQRNQGYPFMDTLRIIETRMNDIKLHMWDLPWVLKKNSKDDVIEATMVITLKVLLSYGIIFEQQKQLKDGHINKEDYKCGFFIIEKELLKGYLGELILCEKHINNIIDSLVKNRDLVQSLKDK